MSSRGTSRAIPALLTATLLAGCGFEGVYSLPLPGAVGSGDDTYQVKVEFQDVLDLVPYSAVKVQNATVGHVVDVRRVDGHAEVVVQLLDTVVLPANAIGRVAETSLLGEKYVSLDPPRDEPATGRLADGGVVTLARTTTGATVEEVLSALSLVLNGGGLDQVRTITVELNKALEGREDGVRSVLEQLDTFVAGLEEQKADIVRALEGVERLSATLASQEQVLVQALDSLPPALEVLAEQRVALTRMLTALGELGIVGSRVIVASREDIVANLRQLQPTLTQLALAGEDIPKSLDVFVTYPFARKTRDTFHGDYGNVWMTINLYPPELARNFGLPAGGAPAPDSVPLPGLPSPPGAAAPGGAPPAAAVPPLADLLGGGGEPPTTPQLPSRRDDPASDIADMLFGGPR